MAFLSEWIRQIAFLLLFASVAGLLVPTAKLKGYFRLILGLVLLLAVLSPLSRWLGQEVAWSEIKVDWSAGPPPSPERVRALETLFESQVWNVFQRSLEQDLVRLVQEEIKNRPVTVHVRREEGNGSELLREVEITVGQAGPGTSQTVGATLPVKGAPSSGNRATSSEKGVTSSGKGGTSSGNRSASSEITEETKKRIIARVAGRLGIAPEKVVFRLLPD